jgi:hypothetical protein
MKQKQFYKIQNNIDERKSIVDCMFIYKINDNQPRPNLKQK